jgi:vacuolar-type H+-ATPase subunit E/Vma4
MASKICRKAESHASQIENAAAEEVQSCAPCVIDK